MRDRDDIREARMGIVGQNTIDFKRVKILEEQRGLAIGIVQEGERASDRGRRWRRRRRRRMRRAVRGKQRVTFLFPFTYDPIFRPESESDPTSGEGVRLALARMLVYPLDIYPVGGPQSTYSTWMV